MPSGFSIKPRNVKLLAEQKATEIRRNTPARPVKLARVQVWMANSVQVQQGRPLEHLTMATEETRNRLEEQLSKRARCHKATHMANQSRSISADRNACCCSSKYRRPHRPLYAHVRTYIHIIYTMCICMWVLLPTESELVLPGTSTC